MMQQRRPRLCAIPHVTASRGRPMDRDAISPRLSGHAAALLLTVLESLRSAGRLALPVGLFVVRIRVGDPAPR